MERPGLISHFKLHFIVIIYGFTAILGKLISLDAELLVWYRMAIALVTFLALFLVSKTRFILPLKDTLQILGVGLIVAMHWISFFGAIQLSNISVTLGCFASTTLFTSLLEPIFFKKKVSFVEVMIGLMVISGLYLIFRFETNYRTGILVALLSAFLSALFTVLNRKLIARHKARVISFWEMSGGVVGLTVYFLAFGHFFQGFQTPSPTDAVYLFILGVICTAFAFVIQVDVMKELTAYVVALTINLEPVYGILLAFLFFGNSEIMSAGFYLGTCIILISVIGYPVYRHLRQKTVADGP